METAKKWIDDCKGKLVIEDDSVIMDFSRSKMAVESHRDWVCSKCGTQNFSSKRRNTCFTCNTPKDENDETKELGSTPCKVLILRGLDILTTEETIRQSLASFTSTPIFDVRLIKDKLTGTSRGFCFIELGSIEEATQLREELQAASFTVDEKVLVISYAKFGTNPSKSGTVAVGSCSSSATTSISETPSTSSTANPSRSKFAANAIAQARAAAQMGHTTDPQMGSSMDHYSTAETTFPATQAASSTVQDTAVSSEVSSETSTVTPVDSTAQTPAPQAISSYVYDTASGYYYDTTTGLYYDPTTQYYYNGTTQQYMYWDATTQQYVTVVSSASTSDTQAATSAVPAQPPSEAENTATSKEKQKKAKSLNAKKIAKDMERWAKKQAKNKEAARPQATAQATQDTVKESTYQYDPNDLKGGIIMSVTGSSNITSLATASPLAALSELDDPVATSAPPAGMNYLIFKYDKSANKPSTSCVRTACPKLSTSLKQAVNNLLVRTTLTPFLAFCGKSLLRAQNQSNFHKIFTKCSPVHAKYEKLDETRRRTTRLKISNYRKINTQRICISAQMRAPAICMRCVALRPNLTLRDAFCFNCDVGGFARAHYGTWNCLVTCCSSQITSKLLSN
ncbi:RNA-binding 5-like, partial [Paramuricea clavata]